MANSGKKKTAVKKAVKGKAAKKTSAINRKTPVKKKTATKKVIATKKVSKKKVASKSRRPAKADASLISITPEDRWKMIATAAYHKAEARGFAPGNEVQDWLKAEEEVDKLITG
jgi:hypothetical protein